MSNKRQLKQSINYISSELFAECVAASLYGGTNPDAQNVDALLTSILQIHNNYISRVSHPEPGMPAKKYYKVLISDFNKQVDEIVDQICALGQ
ncbi:MAG: hypothetical protein PUF37_05070 [Prevotellaceae bacterium]|nr:hypothetical protein [Prevotellaceae bacterium]